MQQCSDLPLADHPQEVSRVRVVLVAINGTLIDFLLAEMTFDSK
jgi:hypothetical protein